ncbi:phosphoribosylglycinamide formyltransferase [Paraurantiacibacter namhicola]|uniref:Phosphoribosylglycinamide formyltransferase n=1 Tax=Paraurantiacibacter namhicola TaxID=645517 RepID=A0A1C7DAQ9_9SPHN|nr:phosphoribosylglycinamide formyltransferase [Paraurantiacibacter namhicola]ANU08383.1 Phosphoribosylglycinamide formyltransferase [Paraurantiacibacter namhicola]
MAETPRARIAVLLSGTGTTMSALLFQSRLPQCPYEIVAVGSNDPTAFGLKVAAAEGIATFAHPHSGMAREDHEALMQASLHEHAPDYVALCGYMRILTPGFVDQWAGRMVNTHPSLLPKYKGLDTHQRAIDAGDSHGGCSVHIVTGELDDGPVLGQLAVPILPGEDEASLRRRVQMAEYQLYPHCLEELVSRPYRADWLLERVRAIALALPEAEERESHGAPAFHTGGKSGKFFAHFSETHHGSEHIAVLVKVSGQDELATLVEQFPKTWFKPAYYGASGWAGLILNRADTDWEHVAEWMHRSWAGVAPKRLAGLQRAAEQF